MGFELDGMGLGWYPGGVRHKASYGANNTHAVFNIH